jgi:hypothetical protein
MLTRPHQCINKMLNQCGPTRAVLLDTVPLVVSRQLLTAFAHSIAQLPPELQKEVAEKCVSTVPARSACLSSCERAPGDRSSCTS